MKKIAVFFAILVALSFLAACSEKAPPSAPVESFTANDSAAASDEDSTEGEKPGTDVVPDESGNTDETDDTKQSEETTEPENSEKSDKEREERSHNACEYECRDKRHLETYHRIPVITENVGTHANGDRKYRIGISTKQHESRLTQ